MLGTMNLLRIVLLLSILAWLGATEPGGELKAGLLSIPPVPPKPRRSSPILTLRASPVLVDFTGPSCINCQVMARSVFLVPSVQEAFGNIVFIEADTDRNPELADWQSARFQTLARPLYVRMDPHGAEQRWDKVFRPNDDETLGRFLTFLTPTAAPLPTPTATTGDLMAASETGSGTVGAFASVSAAAAVNAAIDNGDDGSAALRQGSWATLIIASILGGLFTLIMPCTYPMIPMTVNFFTKQGENGKSVWPIAAAYAFGIIGSFVGIGLVVAGILGRNPTVLAGHWVTNLIIGLLFPGSRPELAGCLLLAIAHWFSQRVRRWSDGCHRCFDYGPHVHYCGLYLHCTDPGAMLGTAMHTGQWTGAVVGMLIYGFTIAVPFFALAMSPSLLKKLPGAGSWMNEFKVVGGIVEIAAALKFLVIVDVHWGWNILTRQPVVAIWTLLSLISAAYIWGALRLPSDTKVDKRGPVRILFALAFLGCGVWLAAGFVGMDLGAIVEAFFPIRPDGVR